MSLEDDIHLIRQQGNAWFNNPALLALERIIEAAQIAEKESASVLYEDATHRGPEWFRGVAVLSFMAERKKGNGAIPHYVIGRVLTDGGDIQYCVRTDAQIKSPDAVDKKVA